MMKRVLSVLIVALSLIGSQHTFAQKSVHSIIPVTPKRELRAVWLTTIGGLDWPHSYCQSEKSADKQKAELCSLLDRYKQAGINTVLLQTRIRGTVIYPSAIEPWDGCITGFPGKAAVYDPMAFAVQECHRRGMELHAWIVCMPIGKRSALGSKWLLRHHRKLVYNIGNESYMNPEAEGTPNYIADICDEIVSKYDVDGIHLDYIRYPENWNRRVNADVARQNITAIVKCVSQRVKALKPWVKLSCSPIGKYADLSRYWSHGWNAYSTVYQEAQKWLQDGWMDELFPMMYFKGDQFYPFAINWKEESGGHAVAPGLGIYLLSPKEKDWPLGNITQEMYVLRQYGLGQAFFRGKFLTDDVKGIYKFVCLFNSNPALVPAATDSNLIVPESPKELQRESGKLSWKGVRPVNGCPNMLYNVYASARYPVDVTNSENLLFTATSDTSIVVPRTNLHYAVTSMDRFGLESKATQEHNDTPNTKDIVWLDYDSKTQNVRLDSVPQNMDVKLIVVETLQKQMVGCALFHHGDKSVRLPNLRPGIYSIIAVTPRGASLTLGRLMLKL